MAQFSRLVPVCGTPAFLDCYQSQAATTTGRIITDKCSTLRRHLSCAEELIQRLFMFSGLKESDATRQDCTTTTLFDDNVHCFRLHCCAAVNNYILIALNLILCQIRQTTWSLLMCSFSLFFFRPVKYLLLEFWIIACNLTWSQCTLTRIIILLIKRLYINRVYTLTLWRRNFLVNFSTPCF